MVDVDFTQMISDGTSSRAARWVADACEATKAPGRWRVVPTGRMRGAEGWYAMSSSDRSCCLQVSCEEADLLHGIEHALGDAVNYTRALEACLP